MKPQAPIQAPAGGVDVEPMIAKARAGIPAKLQPMFDKVVLSGMRIMFDKASHKMMLEQLNGPGPLEKRLSDGIIALMFMLWQQSNKTIPPQLMVPATLVLTMRAFQFLQLSKDPEATKEVLGEATAEAVQGLMDRFGATQDKLASMAKGGQPGAPAAAAAPGAPPAAGAPQGGGMLDAVQGA